MKKIGLTGGIGTGKSTVSDYLKQKGVYVLDADVVSRQVVLPGSPLLVKLSAAFGMDILLPDGNLDRRRLGAKAFCDSQRKRCLDEIMHGAIMERIAAEICRLEQENKPIAVIDAALLLETDLKTMVDEIWLVDVDEVTQVMRVRKRDDLSETEIKNRISNQMPREQKRGMAHFIIDNSRDLSYLFKQVDTLLNAAENGGKS